MKFAIRFLPLLFCSLSLSFSAFAQAPSDFEITKIDPSFQKTPQYNVQYGPQILPRSKDWLEVDVEFSWDPRGRVESKYTDELTFTYYILLNNKSPQNPHGTLLTGQVTHVAIAIGKGMRSVMYVSPKTLERFFDGKIPSTPAVGVIDVGVTITKQGQLVASKSWKGVGPWWSNQQQTAGYVLNKNETPYAPLFWDHYEAIKSRPSGP